MIDISLGMNRQQVIEVLGSPSSVKVQGDIEYLNYNFYETDVNSFQPVDTQYFIGLVDGKVGVYGKLGDFDSAKALKREIESGYSSADYQKVRS